MVDMEPASDQYKRQKLGFEDYSDSKVLSDITIRYGALGERTFEAHRILLSAKAYWFKAAFTGKFAESSAREITLEEDDSDALLTMLNFAYDQKIPPPDDSSSGTPLNIRHCLHLYRVGDKYDYPQFRDQAVSLFKCSMGDWSIRRSDPFPEMPLHKKSFVGSSETSMMLLVQTTNLVIHW